MYLSIKKRSVRPIRWGCSPSAPIHCNGAIRSVSGISGRADNRSSTTGSDRYDVTLMPAMLDEVTVTMRQPQKDLSKIARFVPCVNWYEELTGTLSISEITEIPAAKVYDGRLTLIYIPSTDRRPQMVGIGRFSPTFTSAPGEKSTFKAIQESIYAAFVHPAHI